ncbi:hypothetical protein ACFWCB_18490 [Streptomyces sp. NPDC060048]|uniref:hypothetical protein n=1 Tax=unclassified Streptomyces TaxID=2593676 RepID=UPI003687D396
MHEAPYPTSFVHHHEIARFLHWAGERDFTGPVNAASDGQLDVLGLCGAVAEELGRRGRRGRRGPLGDDGAAGQGPRYRVVGPGEPASPFSFDRAYAMDNDRARALGFAFGRLADWLPDAVAETAGALRSQHR